MQRNTNVFPQDQIDSPLTSLLHMFVCVSRLPTLQPVDAASDNM